MILLDDPVNERAAVLAVLCLADAVTRKLPGLETQSLLLVAQSLGVG
jgi:hypothetical protein